MLQLRSVGRLRAGRKLHAEVEALSEGTGGIEGHMAAEDGWVFSTSTSSLAEDASALFPAGCRGWQWLAFAHACWRGAGETWLRSYDFSSEIHVGPPEIPENFGGGRFTGG